MIRFLIAVLMTFALASGTAEAFDKKRIKPFCEQVWKGNRAEIRSCIAGETRDGKLIDEFKASASLDIQKAILARCLKTEPRSYMLAVRCIDRQIAAAKGEALPDQKPEFDTIAYCKSVSAAVGGSYQIEALCREEEQRAMEHIRTADVPVEIMKTCTQVARAVGGSYQIAETCISEELKAKASLQ